MGLLSPGSTRLRRRLDDAPPVLLFAQATHITGDAAVTAALAQTIFFAVPVGEARLQVALYLALAFAPYALLSPVATHLLGRGIRAYGAAVAGSHAGRAVLAALLVHWLQDRPLYPLAFAILLLSRFHSVARHSLMPRLIRTGGDLLQANAGISIVSAVAGVTGGTVGLAFARLVAPEAALVFAAVVFATGSMSALWLNPPMRIANQRAPKPAWLGDDAVRSVVVALVGARAALGFTSILIAFTFHGEGPVRTLVALGTLAAASGVAPLAIGAMRRLLGSQLPAAALGLLALPAVAVFFLDGLAAALVLAGGVGFLVSTARLGFDAAVQARVGSDLIGRAYARYEAALQLGWVLGAAAGSLLDVPLSGAGYPLALLAAFGVLAGRISRPAEHQGRETAVSG